MVVLTPTPMYIVHLDQTDGDIVCTEIEVKNIDEYIKYHKLAQEDYMIFRGEVIKQF